MCAGPMPDTWPAVSPRMRLHCLLQELLTCAALQLLAEQQQRRKSAPSAKNPQLPLLRQLLLVIEDRPDLVTNLQSHSKLQQLCELLCHVNHLPSINSAVADAEGISSARLRWPNTMAAVCQQVRVFIPHCCS